MVLPVIPHIKVLEKIGQGGMGEVYKAFDIRLERYVAIKLLQRDLSFENNRKSLLIAEAKAAARLNHPNITTIYQVAETDSDYLIIMEYVEGIQLSRLLYNENSLELDSALNYAIQIAEGIRFAHKNNIWHCDIKAENIMLKHNEMIKIMDFGLAKFSEKNQDQIQLEETGSTAYKSPEQVLSLPVTYSADIWSFGVVMYELLSGKKPFLAHNEQELLYLILNKDPTSITQLKPEIPPALVNIVIKLLQKSIENRYQSFDEIVKDLIIVQHELEKSRDYADFLPYNALKISENMIPPTGERRQVVIVVSKLVGFESLVENLKPERVRLLMTALGQKAVHLVSKRQGVINQFNEDEIVMLFGIPSTYEEDINRAIRTAQSLHELITQLTNDVKKQKHISLNFQTGIDKGLIIVQPDTSNRYPYKLIGEAKQNAFRLSGEAHPGEILILPESKRLVESLFETEKCEVRFTLKDNAMRVNTYKITGSKPPQNRFNPTMKMNLSRFVGREFELDTLLNATQRTFHGNGQFISIMAEAGLGKSRLIHEFKNTLDNEIKFLQGDCHSITQETPFYPFISILKQIFKITAPLDKKNQIKNIQQYLSETDPESEIYLPYILKLLSLQDDNGQMFEILDLNNYQEIIIDVISNTLIKAAKQKATVVTIEDWHWNDEASQKVLQQLVATLSYVSLMVVITFRPEKKMVNDLIQSHMQIRLTPLPKENVGSLVSSLFDAASLSEDLSKELYLRSGGNPFYLEELSLSLHEGGWVHKENRQLSLKRPLKNMEIPTTIQGIVQSRLDRLNPVDLELLKMAAVIGVEFNLDVLGIALEHNEGYHTSIKKLTRLGIIHSTSTTTEFFYRFHHILTRDVVYEGQLRRERKMRHALIGRILENQFNQLTGEQAIVLANHYHKAENWQKAVFYGIKAADYFKESSFTNVLSILKKTEKWISEISDSQKRSELHIDSLFKQERACEILGHIDLQKDIIDRLLSMVKNEADYIRVLVRLGDHYMLTGQLTLAEKTLTEANEKSKLAGIQDIELLTLRSLGYLYVHKGCDDEAISVLQKVISSERQMGNVNVILQDLVSLFTIYVRKGSMMKAKECVVESMYYAPKVSGRFRVYSLFICGSYWRQVGEVEKAIPYFQEIIDMRKDLGMSATPTVGIVSLAHCYLEIGKINEALFNFDLCIDLCQKGKIKPQLAIALHEKGKTLISISRFSEALPLLEQAVSLYDALSDMENAVTVMKTIATTHELNGDYNSAFAAWEKVLKFNKGKIEPKVKLLALKGQAKASRNLFYSIDAVEKMYNEALQIAEELGNVFEQGWIWNSMGIVFWERKEYEHALACYHKALSFLKGTEDAVHTGFILNSMASTLMKLNRNAEAMKKLKEAMKYHNISGQLLLKSHALTMMGDIQIGLNDLGLAKIKLEEAFKLRQQVGDRKGEGWVLAKLAKVYKSLENESKSMQLAKEAVKIAKEVEDTALLEESLTYQN